MKPYAGIRSPLLVTRPEEAATTTMRNVQRSLKKKTRQVLKREMNAELPP